MRMKKIFLVLAAALCVATVSAQSKLEQGVDKLVKTAVAQKWSVGLRVGSHEQAVAECFYSDNKYFEGRLGLGVVGDLSADFALLHNWNCCNWDWTPNAGSWFLDAGVGVNVGGNKGAFWCGVVGQAKFGIKFNKVPIRLAVDVSPSFGPVREYAHEVVVGEETITVTNDAGETITTVKPVVETAPGKWKFHKGGLLNLSVSATYCF